MANVLSSQSSRNQAVEQRAAGAFWLVQAISGLLLVLLLGLHMVAHHFVAEGGLRNYQEVLAYVSNPVIFIIEIIFLLIVTPHAMLGLRAVLLDLGPSQQAVKTINWIVTLLGLVIVVYGIWLAVALQ